MEGVVYGEEFLSRVILALRFFETLIRCFDEVGVDFEGEVLGGHARADACAAATSFGHLV